MSTLPPLKGGHVRLRALLPTFDSWNPYIIKGVPAAGTHRLYATLASPSYDEVGSMYGFLAKSLEVAPDNLSMVVTLQPNAFFHDGSPITAEDVVFSYFLLKKHSPLFRSVTQDIKEAQVLDHQTVKFIFRRSDNRELPLNIGGLPVFSKKFYQAQPFDKISLLPPIGSGPYKIKEFKAGKYIVYERVKDWWGQNLPTQKGQHNFDTIRYRYFRNLEASFEAFKAGNIDFFYESKALNWAKEYNFPAIKTGKIIKTSIPNQSILPLQAFVFNTRREVFKDRRVRKALSLLFDFEWLNKNLFFNLYVRTKCFFEGTDMAAKGIPKGRELEILAPYKEQLPKEIFTQEFLLPITDGTGYIRDLLHKADKLLKEAGWITNAKGERVHAITRQRFTIELLISQGMLERMLQGFIKNLNHLGIQAHLRLVDPTQYRGRLQKFDFDMILHLYSQSLIPGNEQHHFWASTSADIVGSGNLPALKNPIVDTLIQALPRSKDYEDLVAHAKAMSRLILWEYVVLPLYHSPAHRFAYQASLKYPEVFPKYMSLNNFISLDMWWVESPSPSSQQHGGKDA